MTTITIPKETATIVQKQNIIKIGKEPMVILPLVKWEKIKEMLEEWEYTIKFNNAFNESRGEKTISLNKLKNKYNL